MSSVAQKVIENEVFALRNGEQYTINDRPPMSGRWFAIMARTCYMPDGPKHLVRQSDNAPVESAAVIACQMVDGKWQWMQLSPNTKESLGDLMFDSNAEKDTWYYITIEQTNE